MRSKIFLISSILFLVLSVSTSQAGEIYQWTDSDGVVSLTDGIRNVPMNYRDQVTVIKTEELPEDTFTRVVDVGQREALTTRLNYLRELQRLRSADTFPEGTSKPQPRSDRSWAPSSPLNPNTGIEVEEGVHPDDAIYPLISNREWVQFGDRHKLVVVERDAHGRIVRINGAVPYIRAQRR